MTLPNTRNCFKAFLLVITPAILIIYCIQFTDVQKYDGNENGHKDTQLYCKKPRFADPPLPVTALVSFPGSGNTWLRYLIEKATGIYTGSVFHDKDLMEVFRGELVRNGSVVLVKIHYYSQLKKLRKFSRMILLVRNPFQAMIADFNRRKTSDHTGIPSATIYQTKEWRDFQRGALIKWIRFYHEWLSCEKPMLLVRYEDMKKDRLKEVKKILNFIDISVTEDDLKCMMNNSEGLFHRKKGIIPSNIFSSNVERGLSKRLKGFNKIMKEKFNETIDDTLP